MGLKGVTAGILKSMDIELEVETKADQASKDGSGQGKTWQC